MATLYWHNLTADNDGTKRENYATDQAGTVAATAGSMAADDLRFDGAGAGANDNWALLASATLSCLSIRFGMYAGTATTAASAVVTAGWVQFGEGTEASPGTYTGLSGTWNLTAVRADASGEPSPSDAHLTTVYTSHRQTIGNSANPMTWNVVNNGIIRFRVGASVTIYANLVGDTLVIDAAGASTRQYTIRGSITATTVDANSTNEALLILLPADADVIRATNTAVGTLRLTNTARVYLSFPASGSGGATELRGWSQNNTADSWSDIILDDNAILQLGSRENGASEGSLFANPVTVPVGANARIQWGSIFGSYHQVNLAGHYQIDGDLFLQRTGNSRGQIDIVGTKAYSGGGPEDPVSGVFTSASGTLAPSAGVWEGAGTLHCVSASTATQWYRWFANTGALVSVANVIFDPAGTSNGRAGYVFGGSDQTLAFGSGAIQLAGAGTQFIHWGQTAHRLTITNDILIEHGDGSSDDPGALPALGIVSVNGAAITFSGAVTADCRRLVLAGTKTAASSVEHRFAGPFRASKALNQQTTIVRLMVLGDGDQSWVFSTGITGPGGVNAVEVRTHLVPSSTLAPSILAEGAATASCKVRVDGPTTGVTGVTVLDPSPTAPEDAVLSAGSADAFTAVPALVVESGGALTVAPDVTTTLDGTLTLQPGSFFVPNSVGTSDLTLNSAGPHEWSATFINCGLSRHISLTTQQAGTTIVYNPLDTLISAPVLRFNADLTLTTTAGVRVIRPGQCSAGLLPSGFSSVIGKHGTTLTVDTDIRLSLYRSEGDFSGDPLDGPVVIAGDGWLIFSQEDGWAPPARYALVTFDVNTSFAGTVTSDVTLTVDGFNFLRDVRTENQSVNLTVNFSDVNIGGDFYVYNVGAATGNQTVNWSGTVTIGGDYYQLTNPLDTAQHSTVLRDNAVMSVAGDWRPASAKSGGPGSISQYSMGVYAENSWQLTIGGDWLTRIRNTYNFEPVDPGTFTSVGTLIFDLTSNVDGLSVSNEYYGTVANAVFINTSGLMRTAQVTAGAWWFNGISVTGDNITLDMSSSSNELYVGNLASSGAASTLLLPDYAEFYTFAWAYPTISAATLIDLRGFTTVDTSASTFMGVYPDGVADFWFDEADLSAATLDFPGYSVAQPITFRDNVTVGTLQPRIGAGNTVDILGIVTTEDMVTVGSGSQAGTTFTATGTLIVTGNLDLRASASNNPSYDVRLLGNVDYRPRGAGPLRVLDFGGPAAGMPTLTIRREATSFVGDEAAYGVSLVDYPLVTGGPVVVRNEAATVSLAFILGSNIEVASLTTEQASTGLVAFDANGRDLRTPVVVLAADTRFNSADFVSPAPAGSSLVMISDSGPALLTSGTNEAPEVVHSAALGLQLQNNLVAAAYLQNVPNVGALDTQGFNVTVAGAVAILEGSVNLTSLPGTTFTATQFTVSSVDMNPTAAWYVVATDSAVASGSTLRYADASGGIEGDATSAVNGGFNVNWDFGLPPAVGANGNSSIGLGLGLGLSSRR